MKSGLQISLFLLVVGLLRRTSAVMSNDDARATITKLLDSSAMKAVYDLRLPSACCMRISDASGSQSRLP